MIKPKHECRYLPPESAARFTATIGGLSMAFDQSWELWHEAFAELRPFEASAVTAPDVSITLEASPLRSAADFSTRGIALVFDQPEHPTFVRVYSARPTPPSVILKMLCACLVPRRGGLFLHGALLACRDQGILVTGTSGSGKSTLAKLWMKKERDCGSDEAVIVRCRNGQWQAYPTPFWGALPPRFSSTPGEYRLKAHYSLIPPGFPALMKCVFSGDALANRLSLRHAAALLADLPASFLPRQRAIMERMNIIERSLPCCD